MLENLVVAYGITQMPVLLWVVDPWVLWLLQYISISVLPEVQLYFNVEAR